MPDRSDLKQDPPEHAALQQSATQKVASSEGKKPPKLPARVGASKTPVSDRIDVQTSAFVQNNLLNKFKLDGGKQRPKSGHLLEVAHRPLQGRPIRSLSASEMLLHLSESAAALNPDQVEPAPLGDSESRRAWRLHDGSFDLGALQSELNDA